MQHGGRDMVKLSSVARSHWLPEKKSWCRRGMSGGQRGQPVVAQCAPRRWAKRGATTHSPPRFEQASWKPHIYTGHLVMAAVSVSDPVSWLATDDDAEAVVQRIHANRCGGNVVETLHVTIRTPGATRAYFELRSGDSAVASELARDLQLAWNEFIVRCFGKKYGAKFCDENMCAFVRCSELHIRSRAAFTSIESL
jgi:hypothetical protein